MSKLCQGPSCHMYDTTDRKRGPKGNKRNYTRTVSSYGYGNKNFCTLSCYNDWAKENMDRAIDYIGRLRERKVMTPENSWDKRQRYTLGKWIMERLRYYYYNMCTSEQRPLTESQYNDNYLYIKYRRINMALYIHKHKLQQPLIRSINNAD